MTHTDRLLIWGPRATGGVLLLLLGLLPGSPLGAQPAAALAPAATANPAAPPAAAAAPAAPAPRLSAPAVLVMRPDAGVTVTVRFSRPPRTPALRASEGRLTLVGAEGATLRARYVPPAEGPPRLAVLAAWDEADPDPRPGLALVRLAGTLEVPLTASPGQAVELEVAGTRFGPGVADAEGQLTVVVRTPPGVSQARVRVGGRPAGEVALPGWPGADRRCTLLAWPERLRADGEQTGRLFVVVHRPDGTLLPGPAPVVAPSRPVGLGALVELGPGLFAAAYRAPLAVSEGELQFTARLADETPGELRVPWEPVTAAAPLLAVEPTTLILGAGEEAVAELRITVPAADGRPVAGERLEGTASVGQLGPVEDRGDGSYRVRYAPPRPAPPLPHEVQLTVRLAGALVAGRPLEAATTLRLVAGDPTTLRITTRHDRVPADGRTAMPLLLRVTDAIGNPVDCLPRLEVDLGRLEPPVVDPVAGGLSARYTPPELPRLAVRHELRFAARCGLQPLAIEGGLTLAPVREDVPPAPELGDGRLTGPGWLAQPPAGPMGHPERLLEAQVGWLAQWGDGLFAAAGGPSLQLELLQRPADDSPLLYGVALGLVRNRVDVRTDGAGLAPGVGPVELELAQTAVPLLASVRLRWPLLPRLALGAGLQLGGLFSDNTVTLRGLDSEVSGSSTDLLVQLPLGVTLLLDELAVLFELQFTRSLTTLQGAARAGSPLGLVGPFGGLGARVGASWSLP